jgi:hypothetical protein
MALLSSILQNSRRYIYGGAFYRAEQGFGFHPPAHPDFIFDATAFSDPGLRLPACSAIEYILHIRLFISAKWYPRNAPPSRLQVLIVTSIYNLENSLTGMGANQSGSLASSK